MADTFKFVQAQPFSLAGAGAVIGDTSIILKSFQTIDGTNLAMTDFGNIGFMTMEPNNGTLEEQISFSGVTQNGNGTATLTGIKSVTFVAPYTQTVGLLKTHAGSTSVIITNTSGFYDKFAAKADDETITGLWDFPSGANNPTIGNVTYVAPTADTQIATKKYVDDIAIAGAPLATDTVYGISKLTVAAVNPLDPIVVGDNDPRVPTQDENDALVGTVGIPSSTNKYVTNDDTTGTGSVVRQSLLKFGGTGADGALSIAAGTTTISLGNATYFEKNYTSISITGTGALDFSNPNSAGTIIVLKSQGNVTLTSSTAPMISSSGMGAAGGAGVVADSDGNDGTASNFIFSTDSSNGKKGLKDAVAGGAGGVVYTTKNIYMITQQHVYRKWGIWITPGSGAGGGGGGKSSADVTAPDSGAGGRGGGGLVIECGGAWNFTTALGISVAGANGVTPANCGTTGRGASGPGGGGGGAAGMLVVLYNSLTANSGTINVSGGTGGNGSNAGGGSVAGGAGSGGGGGGGGGEFAGAGGTGGTGGTNGAANPGANGTNGTNSVTTGAGAGVGGTGGTGSGAVNFNGGGGGGAGGTAGEYVVTLNTEFA